LNDSDILKAFSLDKIMMEEHNKIASRDFKTTTPIIVVSHRETIWTNNNKKEHDPIRGNIHLKVRNSI